jgi:DNA-binding MurR/RpiR family transcriptional regulator
LNHPPFAHRSSPSMLAPVPVQLLVERFGELPPRLRLAARFALDHPDQVAVRSMREVARRAGVAPATMPRLARSLGFRDYEDFRNGFIDSIAQPRGSYGSKVEHLRAEAASRQESLAQRLEAAQVAAIRSASANEESALIAFVDRLTAADSVRFVGMRASHAIAFHFSYVYGLLRDNGRLLEDRGGVISDDVDRLGKKDALVVVSLTPYTRATVELADQARERGAAVLAVTDSPVSPVAQIADHVLRCWAGGPSFFNTMVGPLALVENILARIALRGGRAIVERLRRTDAMLADAGAYLDEAWIKGAAASNGRGVRRARARQPLIPNAGCKET